MSAAVTAEELQAARNLAWGMTALVLLSGTLRTARDNDGVHSACCLVASRALRNLVDEVASGGLLDADDVIEVAQRYSDAAETLRATVTS